jgi:hypothetical protein
MTDGLQNPFDVFGVTEVTLARHQPVRAKLGLQGGSRLGELGAPTSRDHGPAAFRQEGTSRRKANASRRASDEDDLVREPKVHA